MKLKSIKEIKKYKSFQDFSWGSFFSRESFHNDVNILYGENGSGKSSICNILKSVSKNKSFVPKYKPKSTCLSFDDGGYKYPINSDEWDKRKNKEDLLFFDREFVDENVHLGHARDTQQGRQEQKSGKMIIEFDSEAINLRSVREKTRIEKGRQVAVIEKFHEDNQDVLNFQLSSKENKLFKKLKDKTKEEIRKLKVELEKDKKITEKELATDEDSEKKVFDIQNSIAEIKNNEINVHILDYRAYQAVFNFNLKGEVKVEAKQYLIEKLKRNKDFFEMGFKIRETCPEQCPFCQSKGEEKNIREIIKIYDEIYDDTYEEQLQLFVNDRQELINELKSIKQAVDDFDLSLIFLELKKLDQSYKIKKIYSVEEERLHKKPQTKKITELMDKLLKLKKPNKENIEKLHNEVKTEFNFIKDFFINIVVLINDKNKIIRKFKLNNTNKKLENRIAKNSAKLDDIIQKLIFFNERKIENQKRKEQKQKELDVLEIQSKKLKTKHKNARMKYESYASKKAFSKLLQKIEEYFKNFNFSFKLKLDVEGRAGGATKEFPFAFKVLDSEGNERDLKEGLSEGELQVLSLCFFFAFLDIQRNKKNKILIFDDPITSLDNSNLSDLVDLIANEQKKFSQTFVFTHHGIFFKFLRKKFKTNRKRDVDKLGKEYNIIRNQKELGGSFICRSKSKKFIDELKKFEEDIYNQANQGIDIKLKIVEYGQYLRYEVERFIKNTLLHWNANNFPNAIEGVKNNKLIDNDDLDEIKRVYSFCNWTTSHVDIGGDDHGLEQLKVKISDFIKVYEKV